MAVKVALLALCTVLVATPRGSVALTDAEFDLWEAYTIFETTDVTIERDGDNIVIKSNGIPNHEYTATATQHNPNVVDEQDHQFSVPAAPQYAESPTDIATVMGPIGVAINGVPIFNAYNINGENAVDVEVFDDCNGHPDMTGTYHYHQLPNCLVENTYGSTPADMSDRLVGVALDGFPIYSQYTDGGRTFVDGELDDCNGWTRDGQYEYRITDELPYVIGCFMGEYTSSGAPGGGQMPGGDQGQMPGGDQGQMPGGDQGEMPVGDDGQMPGGNQGQMPSGNQGQMPSGNQGQMPSGNQGQMPSGNQGQMPSGNQGQSGGSQRPGGSSRPAPGGSRPRLMEEVQELRSLIEKLEHLQTATKNEQTPTHNKQAPATPYVKKGLAKSQKAGSKTSLLKKLIAALKEKK